MSIIRVNVRGLAFAAISIASVVPIVHAQAPVAGEKREAPRRAFPCRKARASPRPRSRPTGA